MVDGGTSAIADEGNAAEYFSRDSAVDRYTERVQTNGFLPQERTAVERFFTKSGASVLDVGCGVGRVSHQLDERGFSVTGIDISEPLVEQARSLFPNVDFRVADVTDSGLPAESFDYVVFSFYGLDYVLPEERRLQALRELYRVLKPGGFLLFSSHNSWYLAPDVLLGDRSWAKEIYLNEKNRDRLFSRNKLERVTDGQIEIYLTNPVHQTLQLRKCGFTPIDVVGKHDGLQRLFEKNVHYVAKK